MTTVPDQSEDSPTSSLYDALGQEPAITEVVERFYRRILADPELAGVFDGIDMDRLKAHQVALFSKVLGGPDRYSGRSLEAAHRDIDITDAQYDKVGGHLTAVLEELGAGEQALTTVSTTLDAVRPDIVKSAGS